MVFSRVTRKLRRSAKTFARAPGLSVALILTIALGIGSNAAVYSIVRGLTHPTSALALDDRIVSIYNRHSFHETGPFSQADYERLTGLRGTFDWVDAARISPSEAFVIDHTEVLAAAFVTSHLAAGLNLHIDNGAVISDRMWQRESSETPFVSRRDHIRIDNTTYPIVGIAPGGMEGLYRDRPVDVWLRWAPGPSQQAKNVWVIARLSRNTPIRQAQAAAEKSLGRRGGIEIVPFRDLPPRETSVLSRVKALVTLAAAGVFVIACMNICSLLMARASKRSHETSLLVSLGASRSELAAELLSDSVVISLAGGAVGALLAAWTVHIVPIFFFREDAERIVFAPHFRTIFTGSLLCVAITILFGMMPLSVTVRDRPWEVLQSAGRASSRASKSLWNGIVLGQIALSSFVFLSAILLQQSLQSALQPGAGNRPGNLIALDAQALSRPADFEKVEQQVKLLNGIVPLAWAARLPGNQPAWRFFEVTPAASRLPHVPLDVNVVSANYFQSLGLPLIAGRTFPETPDQRRVGVINQEAADLYFGQKPISTEIIDDQGVGTEITGVVGSPRLGTLRPPTEPTVYFPMTQDCCPRMTMIMSAPRWNSRLLAELQQRVETVSGRGATTPTIDTIEAQLTRSALAILRIVQLIAGTLVCVATILAILGLFSSQKFAESQRSREMGLLIALGAPRWKIFLNVLTRSLRLSLVGSFAGTFLAFLLLQSLETKTGTLGAPPLWAWLSGPFLSAIVALLTSSLPAYRSSRMHPLMVMQGKPANQP